MMKGVSNLGKKLSKEEMQSIVAGVVITCVFADGSPGWSGETNNTAVAQKMIAHCAHSGGIWIAM